MVWKNMTACSPGIYRSYDYCLKFLLVGDSDVGKDEILGLLDDEETETSFCSLQTVSPKVTIILLEGKTVKLQIWDTSGQGRFSTIIRSYSRGAQGVLVVYDITSRWSFDGISRWLKEIDEHAPGIPKILVGNRLHLEFRRQVSREDAEHFAKKKNMEYFEVSTLALFNIRESFTELSRLVLSRNGMERLWKNCKVLSLQELCSRTVMTALKTVHDIDRLPLPVRLQLQIKSFADSAQLTGANTLRRCNQHHKRSGSDFMSIKRNVACSNSNGLTSSTSFTTPFFSKLTNRRRRATVTLPQQTPPVAAASSNGTLTTPRLRNSDSDESTPRLRNNEVAGSTGTNGRQCSTALAARPVSAPAPIHSLSSHHHNGRQHNCKLM